MGSPDIRDIVEHVDTNNDNVLDPKEWKLIADLFGAQPKTLKAEIQKDFSKDKFMTDEQRKQIAINKQLEEDIKNDNKEVKKYNERLDSLKKSLENPKILTTLVSMLWDRINLITKKEDIQFYKDFLSTVQNNIQNKLPSDDQRDIMEWLKDEHDISYQFSDINTKLISMNTLLSQKESEFLVKENSTIDRNNDFKQTEVNQEVSAWNLEWLKKSLDVLDSNEISEFKWVIDNLKNGLLTPEKIPQFASMMNILRQMNGLSKDQIMSVVKTTIDTKFADKKDSPEINLFKETLSAVLDKWLVSKFINQVDQDLNKNEKLQWASYDTLLIKDADLSSPEAKAGINTIFNRDESAFNKLMSDFADPIKTWQVENIIKEYIKSDFPDTGFDGTKIVVWEVTLATWEKKKCFNVMKDNAIIQVPSGRKDANGKDIMQNLTPFFWDAKTGKAVPMEQCLTSNLMKDVLWKNNLALPWVANVMKELITVNGKKLSFSEAITSLFNSPLFDQIKQAIYTLMAMFGKEDAQEKAMIEANYLTLKGDVRKRWSLSYKDKDGKDQTISYIDALNKFEPLTIKDGENYKAVFLWLSTDNQKKYIETAITSWRDSAYIYLESVKWNKKAEKDPANEDKENKNAVILVEWKETIIWTHKVIKQWDYYLIDGKPSDGTIFVKNADGKLTKETLNSDNISFDSQDVTLIPNETIATLYPKNSEALAQGKEDIFRYYALESSGDVKNPNPIDELLKLEGKTETIDKIISTMKKKFTWLDSTKRTKLEIQKIFQEWLNALQWIDMWDNKTQYNTALNKRATAVGIETSNIATVTPKLSDASKKT